MIGTVAASTRDAGSTQVRVVTEAGARTITFAACADHDGAARVRRALRRCLSVQLSASSGHWVAVVRGLGHRRPVAVPVSTATALAFVEQGLPAVVRLP